MQFYEDYIKGSFKAKVQELRKVCIFDYKKEKQLQIDQECEKFLDYLLKNDNLWKLADTSAGDLEVLIETYKNKFPSFALPKADMKKTLLYKCAYYLFVDIGYKNLDAPKLFDAIGADVCPYCNRVFVRAIKTNKDYTDIQKGKKVVRGELDHFYTKELYPFLAVCRNNLVPSCSYCNGVYGKFTHDAIKHKLYNPYLIKDDYSESKFKVTFPNGKALNYKDCIDGIRIDFECDSCLEGNKKEFCIQELYESHKDYAAELYQIAQMRMKNQYYKFLKHSLEKNGCRVTKGDVERLLIRNYVDPKDFNKRPLSKFMYDIAKDLDLLNH